MAVELTISIVPIAPFVTAPNNEPKPIAGERHAKNRKRVAARHCVLRPSVISDL